VSQNLSKVLHILRSRGLKDYTKKYLPIAEAFAAMKYEAVIAIGATNPTS